MRTAAFAMCFVALASLYAVIGYAACEIMTTATTQTTERGAGR